MQCQVKYGASRRVPHFEIRFVLNVEEYLHMHFHHILLQKYQKDGAYPMTKPAPQYNHICVIVLTRSY